MNILLVDDHAMLRRGLRDLLGDEFPNAVFAEAASAAEAVEHLARRAWDLVLVDITMPGRSGIDLLKDIRKMQPKSRVLVLSMHPEEQFAVRALRAGADGYMTKRTASEELVSGVRRILAGGRFVSRSLAERLADLLSGGEPSLPHERLSDREFEVFRHLVAGKTVKEIGADLSLSVQTVSTHRARLLRKMGLETTSDLVAYARTHRLDAAP